MSTKTKAQTDTEIVSSISKEDVEVIPLSSNQSHTELRKTIRDSISQSDESLAVMWDMVNDVKDPNEMLLMNLREFQVIHRGAQNEYWAKLKRDDARLDLLLEEGDSRYEDYKEAELSLKKENMADRRHLSDLAKTIKQLSQEYRQCAMQQKYNIHISKVIEWRLAMESAVNRNVTDVNTRRSISNDMREASRALSKPTEE